MKNIKLVFPVKADLDKVIAGFNKDLFLSLAPGPPFPKAKLLRYDGSKTNDLVIIELSFPFFTQVWESIITNDQFVKDQYWQFTDEGKKLPFFLKQWKHIHRVEKTASGVNIIEDIYFQAKAPFFNWMLYPLLKLQFAQRGPVYRTIFEKH